jgi:hypothetical protein
MRRSTSLITSVVCVAALGGLGTAGSAAAEDASAKAGSAAAAAGLSPLERIALPMGLQVAGKHAKRPKQQVGGTRLNAPNPYLSLVPDPSRVDFAYWAGAAGREAGRRVQGRTPAPAAYQEKEPRGGIGANDTRRTAEPISGFGHGDDQRPAVRIAGRLAPPSGIVTRRIQTREDQGSIRQAKRTRIPYQSNRIVVSSRIGDGPHGRAGTGRGDFDFYKVRARAGETISARTVAGTNFDTVIVLYDAQGAPVAADDDGGRGARSALDFTATESGAYYVMVTGFIALPRNPFRSGSGTGAMEEGRYTLRTAVIRRDTDYYAVTLAAGDVLGGTVRAGAHGVQVFGLNGRARIGSTQNASYTYPMASPLPGGGNADFAYVAEAPGAYAVAVSSGGGRYDATLEVFRPGAERSGQRITQRIFLDFDGERVNTGVWGGLGASELSPLSAFLDRWKLSDDQLDAVIDEVVETVTENVDADLRDRGLNDRFDVEILNSRDHADPFGQPNVSRVVVGGTIEESGVPTIGIAQSIDPGNYEREETALVLLDVLSDPDRRNVASLNRYLRPRSDRVGFVGTALGNVVSHEIGHYIGSFHVDQFNDVHNLMDAGGNFPLLYGAGADRVGGTADDPDVDFGVDAYDPAEGFTGLENTLNASAWASAAP